MKFLKRFTSIALVCVMLGTICFNVFAEEAEDTAVRVENTVARPSVTGKLEVTGGKLTDSHKSPVQLIGASTSGLCYYPEYVNDRCFADLASWGLNVIRLALYSSGGKGYCDDGTDREYLKSVVENGVEYATKNDMYVIIDWHILNDNDPRTFQNEAMEFFDEMSALYADYDNVLYELCNEPHGVTWDEIKEYAEALIPVIRKNDPDAVIIVGTPNFDHDIDIAAAQPIEGYDNLMYSCHFYAASHGDNYLEKLQNAIDMGCPVFVTECNATSFASEKKPVDEASMRKWLDVLNTNNISYVFWSVTNKYECHAMLKPTYKHLWGFTYSDLSDTWQWLYDNVFPYTKK